MKFGDFYFMVPGDMTILLIFGKYFADVIY